MSEGFTSNVSWQSQLQSKYMSIEQKRVEEDSSAGYSSSATSPSTSGHSSDVNHHDRVDFEITQNPVKNSCSFLTYFDTLKNTKNADFTENSTETTKVCVPSENKSFFNTSETVNFSTNNSSESEKSASFLEEKACINEEMKELNILRLSNVSEETVTSPLVRKIDTNDTNKTLQDPEMKKKILMSLFLKIPNTKTKSSYFEMISEMLKNKNLNESLNDFKSLVGKKSNHFYGEIKNSTLKTLKNEEEKIEEKVLSCSSSPRLKPENLRKRLEDNDNPVESSFNSTHLQNCTQHYQSSLNLKTKFSEAISSPFDAKSYQKKKVSMEPIGYSDFTNSSAYYGTTLNKLQSKLPSNISIPYQQQTINSNKVSQSLYIRNESSQLTNIKDIQQMNSFKNSLEQRSSPQNKRPRLRASANGAGEFINGFWIPTRSRSCYVCGKSFKNIYR